MSRFDHPVYRNHPSARARTAQQPATEDSGRLDSDAGVEPATPSPWPLFWFGVLSFVGVVLITGLLP